MKPAHEFSRQASYGENGPAGTVRVTSAYGFRPPNLSNDRPRYADARVAERRRRGSYRVGKSPPPRAIHRIGPWRSGMLVVRLTALIVCLHKLEILLLALFYRLYCFSTWESAFYFSATSYSSVRYGDLLLPRAWRLAGPKERITGVLICAALRELPVCGRATARRAR